MATIRIAGNGVPEHEAMHDLKLHHDAPVMVEVDGMLLPAEAGDYETFTTREDVTQLAAKIREHCPGAEIEVKGWFGRWFRL